MSGKLTLVSCYFGTVDNSMEIQIVSITGINTDVLPVCSFNSAMSKGYSTMSPVQSPMMSSVREVMDWFNTSNDVKPSFVKEGYVCIYVHIIANQDTCIDGYNAIKGEVISTDEAAGWDYINNKWVPWS